MDTAREAAEGADVGSGQQRRFRRHVNRPAGAEDSGDGHAGRERVSSVEEAPVQERHRPQSRRECGFRLALQQTITQSVPRGPQSVPSVSKFFAFLPFSAMPLFGACLAAGSCLVACKPHVGLVQ